MRVLKAGFMYFGLVFVAGFALGIIRVPLVAPRLGVRLAELLEMPLMILASYFAARFCLQRLGPFTAIRRLVIGGIALAFLVIAELGLTLAMGQGIGQYVASRDPVSGIAYLISLALFSTMPLFTGRGPSA